MTIMGRNTYADHKTSDNFGLVIVNANFFTLWVVIDCVVISLPET